MHNLIQILLPTADNEKQPFDKALYGAVQHELVARFGGLTSYQRAPADGLWTDDQDDRPVHDTVILFEIITDTFDRVWWRDYKAKLKTMFRQDDILIRVQTIELL